MASEANVPSEASILAGLHELAELRAARDLLGLDYEAKRQAILAIVSGQLAEVEDEYAPNFRTVDEKIGELEEMLKQAALLRGASVAGEQLQVVVSKPRTTWDSAGLNGYAVAHPEILAFRKQGDASSVSIQARRTK